MLQPSIERDNRFRFGISLVAFPAAALLSVNLPDIVFLHLTLLFLFYSVTLGLLHLLSVRNVGLRVVSLALTALDAGVATGLVALTGLRSPFFLLYFAVIGSASQRSEARAIYAWVLCLALYAGVAFGGRFSLVPVLDRVTLVAFLGGASIFWLVALRGLAERRTDERRKLGHADALMAVADILHGAGDDVRDKMRKTSRLLFEELSPFGFRCRIALESEPSLLPPEGGRLGLHIPVEADGRRFGTLIVSSPDGRTPGYEEHRFLETLARTLGYFLYRHRRWEARTIVAASDSALAATLEGPAAREAGRRAEDPAIENLLEMVRIQQGRFQIEPGQCRLTDILTAATKALEPLFVRRHLRCELEGDVRRMPAFTADAEALRRVVANLLSAAALGAPDGSRISVAGSQDAEGVVVSVIHEVGKPEKSDDDADRSATAHLALRVAKTIIEAHQGNLWIEPMGERRRSLGFEIPIAARLARQTGPAA